MIKAPRSTQPRALVRDASVALLTGTAGKLAAFVADVGVAGARYWAARLAGRETPW
jgi:hypothetical protein